MKLFLSTFAAFVTMQPTLATAQVVPDIDRRLPPIIVRAPAADQMTERLCEEWTRTNNARFGEQVSKLKQLYDTGNLAAARELVTKMASDDQVSSHCHMIIDDEIPLSPRIP